MCRGEKSTGPSTRYEVEKAWGVRTKVLTTYRSGYPERLPQCADRPGLGFAPDFPNHTAGRVVGKKMGEVVLDGCL